MKNLAEKLFDMSPWKMLLICFPIFTIFSFIVIYLFDIADVNYTKVIITSIIFGTIFTLVPISVFGLAKTADKFYRYADKIEEMIRKGEDKDLVLSELLKLQKESFHRETGNRVNELGKMYEIKYDVRILKR